MNRINNNYKATKINEINNKESDQNTNTIKMIILVSGLMLFDAKRLGNHIH